MDNNYNDDDFSIDRILSENNQNSFYDGPQRRPSQPERTPNKKEKNLPKKKKKTPVNKPNKKTGHKQNKLKSLNFKRVKKDIKPKTNRTVSPKHKKTGMIIAAIIAILLALILIISITTPMGLGEALSDTFACIGKGSQLPASLSADILTLKTHGGKVITVDSSVCICRNTNGGVIFNRNHEMSNPGVSMNDSRVLIFDRGGKALRVENSKHTVTELTCENVIYTADLGANGSFAVATDSVGYSSQLIVYNSRGEEKYIWYSAQGKIICVSVSDNGKYVSLCRTYDNKNETATEIILLDTSKVDPIFSKSYDGELPISIDFKGNRAVALMSGKIASIDTNGKSCEYDLSDGELSAYDNSSPDGIAVILNSYGDSRKNTVKFIMPDGNEKCSFNANHEITGVSYSSGNIATLSGERIISYNMSGKTTGNFTCEFSPIFISANGESVYYCNRTQLNKKGISTKN